MKTVEAPALSRAHLQAEHAIAEQHRSRVSSPLGVGRLLSVHLALYGCGQRAFAERNSMHHVLVNRLVNMADRLSPALQARLESGDLTFRVARELIGLKKADGSPDWDRQQFVVDAVAKGGFGTAARLVSVVVRHPDWEIARVISAAGGNTPVPPLNAKGPIRRPVAVPVVPVAGQLPVREDIEVAAVKLGGAMAMLAISQVPEIDRLAIASKLKALRSQVSACIERLESLRVRQPEMTRKEGRK